MRKLALKLDELSVETFETLAPLEGHGTVRGHDTGPVLCGESDVVSCGGSCARTECGEGTCWPNPCGGGGTQYLSCQLTGQAPHGQRFRRSRGCCQHQRHPGGTLAEASARSSADRAGDF
jgi:hypothetical protein